MSCIRLLSPSSLVQALPAPHSLRPSLFLPQRQVDSIKELVDDTNLECSASGIQLQAMDSSHVALVSLYLKMEGFDMFRADRNISLGLKLQTPTVTRSLGKLCYTETLRTRPS